MGGKTQALNEHTVSMPLYFTLGIKKRKNHHLNLNNYRNWHYQVSNKLKYMYKDYVFPQLTGMRFSNIDLTFILWTPDKRKRDRSNVLCVHEKFFCDALVELGCIGDDNDKYINSTHYYTGGLDRENPRVDISIKERKPSRK